MDLFDTKSAKAMLIGREEDPFDSEDFVYEPKLDGERCLAYLDPQDGTVMLDKRGRFLLPHVPELADMHRQCETRCILDGELIIGSGMKHEYELIRSRLGTTNSFTLARMARQSPASFIAHDILYLGDQSLLKHPLTERKRLLEKNIVENAYLVIIRSIENRGVAFFKLVEKEDLAGVVAKRKASTYQMGKKSKDWVAFKNWEDDDFVICGYYPSHKIDVVSLVLGQNRRHVGAKPELVYKSHVVLGQQTPEFKTVDAQPRHIGGQTVKWGSSPDKHPKTVWLEPLLVCNVEYSSLTSTGGLRQPHFKGLRDDKKPSECFEKDPKTWPSSSRLL